MKKKPVVDIFDIDMMHNYEYNAVRAGVYKCEVIASNSLINLKKGIKERHWKSAFIQCENGCFSYNQQLMNDVPYIPRYK